MISLEKEIYSNKEDFVKDMYFRWDIGDTPTTEKVINHEKAHASLLEERGYGPARYKAIEIKVNLFAITAKSHIFNVKPSIMINPKDLKDIALAPEKPSIPDRLLASRTGIFFYNLLYRLKEKEEK